MNSAPGSEAGELLSRLSAPDWRARQEALEALEQWEEPLLARALVDLVRKKSSDLSALSGALEALERIGRTISPELIALMDDSDPEMRLIAPLILGELGDPTSARALINMALEESEQENARFNAIEALGKLGNPSASPALRELLEHGTPYLRYAAVLALGQIGSGTDARIILPLLEDDYLAEPTVNALAQLGDEQSAPEIVRWLVRRQADGVCEMQVGARALAAIARRSETDQAIREAYLQAAPQLRGCLLALVHDSQPAADDPLWADLALLTGWLAQQIPTDAVIRSALVSMLAYAPARPVVEAAVEAEPLLAQEELISVLQNSDQAQTQIAARLLGHARVAAAVPALTEALDSEDDSLAAPAAEALGRIGTSETFSPLVNALGHPSIPVRRSVIGALAVSSDPRLKDYLQSLLQQADPIQREAALQLYAIVDEKAAAEYIFQAASDPENNVRKAALEMLPRLKDLRVLPMLEHAISDPDDSVRNIAVRACSTMPPDSVRPLLVRAAQDESAWVRMHAVRTLGLLPHPDLLPLFAKSLHDTLAPVRAAAVEALARLPRELAEPHLTEALQDENEDVRLAAQRALENNPAHPPVGKD